VAYVRDLGSADLWRFSEERSRRRRAARERQRRMRRIGVPLAMLVTASGTGATAFVDTAKADSSRRPAARRAHQRILRLHATGPDVAHLQRLLGVRVDGVFGHTTLDAVKRFQRAHGLLVDGQVGRHTRAALLAEDRGRTGELVLRFGSHGRQVAALQRRLEIPADGDFGPITLAAVEAFQRTHGLVVDGQAGPHTLSALRRVGHWPAPRDTRGASHRSHGQSQHRAHRSGRHHRSHGPAHHRPGATSSVGERAVRVAEGYIGVPYVWGGESPSGFDCSGLVQYVYGRVGVSLPRTSYEQYRAGRRVARSELRPGDLVFFDGAGHVGIYAGGGRFIHAPQTGTSVQFGTLSGWYLSNYTGAVRVTG
jgi:peptidoglycan DL-endopeptidase CwlO